MHTRQATMLLATAFILAALLVMQIDRRSERMDASAASTLSGLFESQARGEMVVSKDIYTILSTQSTADSELIYVLDNRNEVLVAYQVDPNRETIEPVSLLDVGSLFEQALQRAMGGGRGGRGGTRGR